MILSTSPTRRRFLAAGIAAAAAWTLPQRAFALSSLGAGAGDFGIAPNLPADQTAALRNALETLRASGTPLILPPGRYVVDGLQLNSGARLMGVAGATRLVSRGSGPLLRAAGVRDVTLSGLVLDGTASAMTSEGSLVQFTEASGLTVEDCTIDTSPGNGLTLTGCGGRITGCSISGVARGGLFSTDGTGLEISSNRISDCGDNGIQVWTSSKRDCGTRVVDNHVERVDARSGGSGQYGNGISVYRAGGVTLSGNRVTDCVYSAIRVNSGSNTVIDGNNLARLGEVALFVEFAFDGAVVSDNLVDGAADGILVTNFDHGGRLGVVSGNLVRNIGSAEARRGTGIFAAADTAVTGNVVENAGFSALTLGYGPYLRDVTATGNVLRRARHGIVVSVVEGTGTALVSDNVLGEISADPIIGMEWEEVVSSDLPADAPRRYPHLTVTGNRIG